MTSPYCRDSATQWLQVLSGGRPSAPDTFLRGLVTIDSLEELEGRARIKIGTPIMIDLEDLHRDPENYRPEPVFTEFLRTSKWSRMGEGSRTTYASVYPPIIRWLGSQVPQRALHEMTVADLDEWKEWRTNTLDNPQPISPATWNKEVSALTLFFEWSYKNGYAKTNPIDDYGARLRFKNPNYGIARSGGWRSKNARTIRIDWIEPQTFRLWSNVAFKGFTLATRDNGKLQAAGEDTAFRARNQQRNSTFVEMIYYSGTREGETSLLFTLELPTRNSSEFAELRIPSSITKSGRSRTIAIPWLVEGLCRRYIEQDRRRATELARSRNAYDGNQWFRITDGAHRNSPVMLI